MLWSRTNVYEDEPFDLEADLESAIEEVKGHLFGPERVYLEVKKKIGKKGKTQNIPDAYLIDLSSTKEPKLYVVEVELAKHDPIKHIVVQIVQFSMSYEESPHTIKTVIKNALSHDKGGLARCTEFASDNGFENLDFLLESMIFKEDSFNALVIIDEVPDELETALIKRFKFPIEIVALRRYANKKGKRLYEFSPFLADVAAVGAGTAKRIDPSDIDTIVVPAREEGFKETFIGENCWYSIRIHSSMIPRIEYIAAYQVAPVSAITHFAPVTSIEQWKDTNKYKLNFAKPAKRIGPIRLVPKGRVKAPQAPRYTSLDLLKKAQNLDEAF